MNKLTAFIYCVFVSAPALLASGNAGGKRSNETARRHKSSPPAGSKRPATELQIMDKVIKTDQEWRTQLTKEQYESRAARERSQNLWAFLRPQEARHLHLRLL
jgi:hypothetical protein